ncbi:MAG: hypothetical protein M1825_001046 [Sarcosagium campestre]|nr:MAG: hypothetical protein M1825_001046 [Sarcosagium campestre]
MPPKKWIDKKAATTYSLVHRSQNDPQIHDAEASSMVFKAVPAPNQKVKTKSDLEGELLLDSTSVRDNEGEAALHGIFYDDSSYDYMQHMRDLGATTEACFVEAAPKSKSKSQAKGKQKLEDALRDATIQDDSPGSGGLTLTQGKPLLDEEVLQPKGILKRTYQDQQDVPDVLAGFQPDMDPRLREVLEALDDEAFVDDDDEVFDALAQDGEEVSQSAFDELDDGWESDRTATPGNGQNPKSPHKLDGSGDFDMSDAADHGDGSWMAEFSKYKQAQQKPRRPVKPPNSSILSSIDGGRRKKRRGARTSSTGYSMTSSSLARTEGLTILDGRFDKIEEEYADDYDDGASLAASSSTSQSQGPIRADFDSMMDDFLGSYSMAGRKRVKKQAYQSGMEQLDEVRKGLGPARVKSQWA